MNGRRAYTDINENLTLWPGDYGQDAKGAWKARTFEGVYVTLASVKEHEDGTITAPPHLTAGAWGDGPPADTQQEASA